MGSMFPPVPDGWGISAGSARTGEVGPALPAATQRVHDAIPDETPTREMAAAPEFLGIQYLHTTESPFCVLSSPGAGDDGLRLELVEVPDARKGKTPQFCLRLTLDAVGADRAEATMIMLPQRGQRAVHDADELAYGAHMLGPYRVRVIKCAALHVAKSSSAAQWAGDMRQGAGYACAIAVDRPTLPPLWTPVVSGKQGSGYKGALILPPMGVGDPPLSLWLSTKDAAHLQVSLGHDEDDCLELLLLPSLLDPPEVACVRDNGDGSWRDALDVKSDDSWVWSVSLDALRLGATEAHATLPLNWARSKSWGGTLRPEARTRSRRGRVVMAGEYQIEVRERVAVLSQLGILHRCSGEGDAVGIMWGSWGGEGGGAGGFVVGSEEDAREGIAQREARKFAEMEAYQEHISRELQAGLQRARSEEGYEDDFEAEDDESADGADEAVPGDVVVGVESAGEGLKRGGVRGIKTTYPIMDFSVLLRVSRVAASVAEDDAWAALLGSDAV